ncbi:DNA/RNA non-specific endonuclease [Gilliamella sp. B2838]|uniref:DNA/RNA non-specific endonuclease n=1 Tax=Gilliamella sp. B2838 TaxID=2818020 RepID=UPI003A5CD7BC|nr:DNA/RNA non-specific endonuclease [Gilliamella sp. B2838]
MLAKILEGSGGTDNVFPQLKGLNRGQYRTFEKRVRRYIEKNGTVDIEWNFI